MRPKLTAVFATLVALAAPGGALAATLIPEAPTPAKAYVSEEKALLQQKRAVAQALAREELRSKPKSEPKPANAEAPAEPSYGGDVVSIITAAAHEFGLDPGYLLGVAECESTLNVRAYNAAGYHGLFQFDYPTWGDFGYGDIYDPVAQARTAARLIADGQTSRWPNCA